MQVRNGREEFLSWLGILTQLVLLRLWGEGLSSLLPFAEIVKSFCGYFAHTNRPEMLVTWAETQWQVQQSCNSTKMDFGENMCHPDSASLLSAVGHGLATSTTMTSEWLSIMWPHLLATHRRFVDSSGL